MYECVGMFLHGQRPQPAQASLLTHGATGQPSTTTFIHTLTGPASTVTQCEYFTPSIRRWNPHNARGGSALLARIQNWRENRAKNVGCVGACCDKGICIRRPRMQCAHAHMRTRMRNLTVSYSQRPWMCDATCTHYVHQILHHWGYHSSFTLCSCMPVWQLHTTIPHWYISAGLWAAIHILESSATRWEQTHALSSILYALSSIVCYNQLYMWVCPVALIYYSIKTLKCTWMGSIRSELRVQSHSAWYIQVRTIMKNTVTRSRKYADVNRNNKHSVSTFRSSSGAIHR